MLQLFFCSQLLVRDNWSFKTEGTEHSKTRISFWIFLGSRILPNLSKNWPQEAARLVRVCVTCEGVCCEGVTGSVCDMWVCVKSEGVWNVMKTEIVGIVSLCFILSQVEKFFHRDVKYLITSRCRDDSTRSPRPPASTKPHKSPLESVSPIEPGSKPVYLTRGAMMVADSVSCIHLS